MCRGRSIARGRAGCSPGLPKGRRASTILWMDDRRNIPGAPTFDDIVALIERIGPRERDRVVLPEPGLPRPDSARRHAAPAQKRRRIPAAKG